VKVVLAEKPSVARDLARFLGAQGRRDGYLEGNGYQVTWAYGHLVTLKEPQDYDPALKRWRLETLPFIPPEFGLKVIDTKLARKQFKIVKGLFRAASEIICATDAGREGELIFRYIQHLSGCTRKPWKRLWLSSLTDRAIREAMENIRDGAAFDTLFAAARCRSEADWIVGLNSTRNFTVRYGGAGTLWSVGRVQTPVLAMIVRRDDEIRRFKPEKFWELLTRYRGAAFKYAGKRFSDSDKASGMLAEVEGRPFTVTAIVAKEQTVPPPLLYDLTALQRDMNWRFGLSAAATLKVAQQLYEAKVTTYPRTDSRFLPSDMRSEIPRILSQLTPLKPEAVRALDLERLRYSARIINDKKVSDHHAIIPTGKLPTGLTGAAAKVFDAVATQFIAAFHPYCKKLNTTVEGVSNQVPFRARGVQVLVPGWTALHPKKKSTTGAKEEEQELPAFTEGETGPHEPLVREGVTKPPPHYTDSSLLAAMETCGKTVEDEELREALKEKGLGTPATRAQTIETLLNRKYLARSGKRLEATDAGRCLIALITDEGLKSPELTGEWEGKLKQLEAGTLAPEQFIEGIATYTRGIIRSSATPPPVDEARLGDCPLCKGEVIEGKRGVGCSGWRDGCPFVLLKQHKSVLFTTAQFRELLQLGRLAAPVALVDGAGVRQVLLLLEPDGELREIALPKSGRGGRSARSTLDRNSGRGRRPSRAPQYLGSPQSPPSTGDAFGKCPACGKPVMETPKAFGCSDWRNGCKFAVWKWTSGKRISADTARTLISRGSTATLKGFKSKAGKPFQARLKIENGAVKLDFS